MKTNQELLKEREKQVPRGPFNVTPLFVSEAKGATIKDVEGKRYIDFAGGIGVENVGHCAEEVVSVIKDQVEKYIHTCFHVVMYEPYLTLAKKLNEITPGDFEKKTMFANSGAEAVENAIKIARYYTKRDAIICFEDAFHGRTLLTMTLTSKVKPYKFGFGPFAPEVYRIPYAYCYRCSFDEKYPSCNLRCAEHLREVFHTYVPAENIAALIVEPVLGEGGVVVPPKEFLPRLKEICKENGILFIVDEIQTGFGRTGKMFATEHFNVEPDIIITGKSLAAGLPLSGITGRAEIMDAPHIGGLGGTFGGNPLACRAALAVFSIFEKKNLLFRAQRIGKRVLEKFKEMQEKYYIIGDVRSLGAMVALEFVRNRKTKEPAKEETNLLVRKCYEKGLILMLGGTYGNTIRTLMPLVISDDELEEGLSILEEGIREVDKQLGFLNPD
ncbi:4-aminobutyrate--2-oxoglutarate transaminase [Candidatus Aerophobetes bacterium]|uniref:4-aminobutyrate--2-oxoglutarate transaminase n=1 Tax=Aerophobetes bacterium TaxID=2030807 RepID=A0A662DLQ5_UNCAE|nr:MAG: 4-aminobutyrate--2-oxoglutarate transaminase [Candidatus Aerophobetes bacterium]